MDGLDAAFAGAFGQPQNNLPPQQEPQQQPQCQCCANQHCQFQGMPVGTLHYCQFCGGIMHGPCGPEIEVQGGMVTIKDSSNINPVPYEQLRSPDPDKPAPHQICGLCIESIKTRQMNERNNYAAAPSTSNPIAASATHPSVIALFPDIPPDTPRDVVDEMLEDAMEGRSGPALQQQWQQFFGTNRSNDPSTRLADLRANFTPEGVKKKAKATSTFKKHQNNNERFILYLYEYKREKLDDNFAHELDDINTDPDYSAVEEQYSKYKKNKGKKSLAERKEDYRVQLLRDCISHALGQPGTVPFARTVDFDALRSSCDLFVSYLCSCRRANGGILKKAAYTGIRSSLTYLFRRYRELIPAQFQQDLRDSMDGVKRMSSEAQQHGEGNIYDGDRPLTWGLYQQFNEFFRAEGTEEGNFGVAFSMLTCNLACRGKSTGQICTKHMTWQDDSMQIPFGHLKDNQDGTNEIKKLPRNCYCNPLNHSVCVVTAVFDYMALNPNVLADSEEAFFSGSTDAQAQRFGRLVKKICLKHKDFIETEFGYDIRDIGVHSWRKCAHTKLNCGSTAGPSAAAACIRGGHSMGTNRDVYIAQERASDTFCGRLVGGLDEHSPEFAVSYTEFLALDDEQTVNGGMSQVDQRNQQAVLNGRVNQALESIFGAENLRNFPQMHRLLRIGLASHLYHRDGYDRLLDLDGKMGAAFSTAKVLPDDAPLRQTPLFTNPTILALKQHVHISMPWEGKSKYFKPASGLPPHVIILAYVKGLKTDISRQEMILQNLPERIEQIVESVLTRHGTQGNPSLDQIIRAIETGPRFQAMASDISALRRMISESQANGISTGRTNNTDSPGGHPLRLMRQYQHSPGVYCRVPKTWKFPKLKLQNMYAYWHVGDEALSIPPMKFLEAGDIKHLGKRATTTLAEIRKVMTLINNEATAQGLIVKDHMNHIDVNTLYAHGEKAIANVIQAKTPTGRTRKLSTMKFSSVIKYMQTESRNRRDRT